MITCYTVGHDSFVPGIIANLNPNRDAIIVGKGGKGRLVFLSPDDPPVIENGKIITAFRIAELREGNPTIMLASSPGSFDEVAMLVMVDTSRSAEHDESSEGVGTLAGSPYTIAETYSRMGNFLSVQGLYALLPGDAIRVRPLGIATPDWAHQRVIFCELDGRDPALKVMSRAQYHKAYGRGRSTQYQSPTGPRAEDVAVTT